MSLPVHMKNEMEYVLLHVCTIARVKCIFIHSCKISLKGSKGMCHIWSDRVAVWPSCAIRLS